MDIELQEKFKLAEKILLGKQPFEFPSIGEFPVYDDLIYSLMCNDSDRSKAYKNAINNSVSGKTVVEIGTGAQAPLAIMCAEAGAEKVYAIEVDKISAKKAEKKISKIGLSNIIEVIHGNSMEVELPEKVDVCVSEIIGTIGSSEGVVTILKDAQRFLKSDGKMIPERCITRIAPSMLPENLLSNDSIADLINYYTKKVFEATQEEFIFTRFSYSSFPKSNILCDSLTFEDDNYIKDLQYHIRNELEFSIQKDCFFDGFLLWIKLYVDSSNVIDSLNESYWGPVFLKTDKRISLSKGDVITATCERTLSKNEINPDYFIDGTVKRKQVKLSEFHIKSYYTTP